MERISTEELQTMLERRWRKIAPKKLMKKIDEGSAKFLHLETAKKSTKPTKAAKRGQATGKTRR
jgi:hypothetical protein